MTDELAEIVATALAKRPEDRFVNAAELSRALRKARGIDAEDAQQLLADTFARDFRDPTLPAMFDLPELDELERAWRVSPPPTVSSNPPAKPDRPTNPEGLRPHRRSDEPTTGGRLVEAPLAQPALPSIAEPSAPPSVAPIAARRGAPVAALVGVAVLAAVGIGVAVWAVTRAPSEGPDVVYVEATPAGIEPGTTAAPPDPDPVLVPGVEPEVQPGPDVAPVPDPAAPEARPRTDRDSRTPEQRQAAAIQQAFGRHTAGIRNCFSSAPPGTPEELVLRFSVDAGGTVQRVELSPAGVAGTSQGQCVTRIAQSIDFPAADAPRTFRIPIEVRSR